MSWTPSRGDPDPRPVGESLERLAGVWAVPTPKVLGAVFARWEEAVGPTVAAHARPLEIADGALVVAVDEPAWATQLRFLEAELLARLAEAAGHPVADRLQVRVRTARGRRPRPGRRA